MSARDGVSPPAYPAVTTTTTDHSSTSAKTTISTTTATTINPEKATPAPPSLAPRPVGWHAKESGFDWNKRSDQHRYR